MRHTIQILGPNGMSIKELRELIRSYQPPFSDQDREVIKVLEITLYRKRVIDEEK